MDDIVGTYKINGELITLENLHLHYEYIHAAPQGKKHFYEEMNGSCFDIAKMMQMVYPKGDLIDVFIIGRPATSPEDDIETLIPHGVVKVGCCIIDPITAASPLCKDFKQAAEYLIPIKKGETTRVPTERMKIHKDELRSKFEEKYWLYTPENEPSCTEINFD